MIEKNTYFPKDFDSSCLVTSLVALSDPKVCIGDVRVCSMFINSYLYSYPVIITNLVNMPDNGDVFNDKSRVQVINTMLKWVIPSNRKKEFYAALATRMTLEFFHDIIAHDVRLAKNMCRNLSPDALRALINSVTWSSRHSTRGVDDTGSYSYVASKFLLTFNMKRLVKESTGTKLSYMYKNSMFPEIFTPSAVRKIPASRWGVVIDRQPQRWEQCEDITKLNPLVAYSLIRKHPEVLKVHPDLEKWKLKGSQWNKLVRNNPEVKAHMPADFERTIAFLILKRK